MTFILEQKFQSLLESFLTDAIVKQSTELKQKTNSMSVKEATLVTEPI